MLRARSEEFLFIRTDLLNTPMIGQALKMNSSFPQVSILICSRARRKDLERLVIELKRMQTTYAHEIVVVEETDDPKSIEGVHYIGHALADRGIAHARNLALARARGSFVVFIDDDCAISENWLDALLEPLKNEDIVAVQGGVRIPAISNSIGWAESLLGFPGGGIRRIFDSRGQIQKTREISTLNCAYKKKVIERIGGFDARLKYGGEDYLLAKQACGYGHCVFVPGAAVKHRPRGSLSKIWIWFVRRGRAEIDVIRTRKQADIDVWKLLRSSLLLKILLAIPLGVAFGLWVLGLLLMAYLMVQPARVYGAYQANGVPPHVLLVLPTVKLLMDMAQDWGRIRGITSA
jgi:GT2 family glycosyltransferase